jgi:hypothetical protein
MEQISPKPNRQHIKRYGLEKINIRDSDKKERQIKKRHRLKRNKEMQIIKRYR